jgi:hypothetical protein
MWIDCNKSMPEDMEVVIALYLGYWPGRGNSGVADIYAADGKWFNIPEGVNIIGWMSVPDTNHLPIAERYTDPSSGAVKLLGWTETSDPDILKCIFKGHYSEVNQTGRNRNSGDKD